MIITALQIHDHSTGPLMQLCNVSALCRSIIKSWV